MTVFDTIPACEGETDRHLNHDCYSASITCFSLAMLPGCRKGAIKTQCIVLFIVHLQLSNVSNRPFGVILPGCAYKKYTGHFMDRKYTKGTGACLCFVHLNERIVLFVNKAILILRLTLANNLTTEAC